MLGAVALLVLGTPLDDYLEKVDEHYSWHTTANQFTTVRAPPAAHIAPPS